RIAGMEDRHFDDDGLAVRLDRLGERTRGAIERVVRRHRRRKALPDQVIVQITRTLDVVPVPIIPTEVHADGDLAVGEQTIVGEPRVRRRRLRLDGHRHLLQLVGRELRRIEAGPRLVAIPLVVVLEPRQIVIRHLAERERELRAELGREVLGAGYLYFVRKLERLVIGRGEVAVVLRREARERGESAVRLVAVLVLFVGEVRVEEPADGDVLELHELLGALQRGGVVEPVLDRDRAGAGDPIFGGRRRKEVVLLARGDDDVVVVVSGAQLRAATGGDEGEGEKLS